MTTDRVRLPHCVLRTLTLAHNGAQSKKDDQDIRDASAFIDDLVKRAREEGRPMPITTMRELARRIDQTFPNATTLPTVTIPWGASDAGLMVDYEDDAFRIGVYGDLTTIEEPSALIHIDTANRAWAVLEFLTENQPEGTDWAAWADHWCREIWPDVRDSFT